MKAFLILLLIFPIKANCEKFDYIRYNYAVGNAEMNFVKADYLNADNEYKYAFTTSSTPSASDLNNAMVNATYLGNGNSFFLYAEKIVSLGVGSRFFSKRQLFQKWKNDQRWKKLLSDADSDVAKKNGTNHNLLEELRLLSKQGANLKERIFRDFIITQSTQEEIHSLTQRLHTLFEKYGYTSERLIGTNIINDTLIQPPMFLDIIRLNQMRPDSDGTIEAIYDDYFKKYLDVAYSNGEIDFFFYRSIYPEPDLRETEFLAGSVAENTLKVPYFNEESVQRTEQLRKNYGLCNFKQYIQKLKFQAEHPNSEFTFKEPLADRSSGMTAKYLQIQLNK